MRNQLDRLFLHYTSLEKARLLLNFHGISAGVITSSAELNSVDLVSISSADLITTNPSSPAPEDNGQGLIHQAPETAKPISPTNEIKEQVSVEGSSEAENQETNNSNKAPMVFTFDRKLKGGVVTNFPPAGAYIPEGEIRKKNFEHGDKLRLVKTYPGSSTTPARHIFEIEEKVALPQSNRIQYNNCILEKDGQIWFVEQYEPFKSAGIGTKLYIRLNDVPYRIHISDEDVRDMKLSLGASIEVAFWENNPTLPKVIWENRDK